MTTFSELGAVLAMPTGRCVCALLLAVSLGWACTEAPERARTLPTADTFTRISERVDPWVANPRVVVMTDIANEPDDQMSMVRLPV